MKEGRKNWKKKTDRAVLAVGLSTMLVAIWALLGSGLHKTGQIIIDFAQKSLPVHYTPGSALVKVAEVKDVTMIGCWPRIQGDNEMDAGPGDYIPVRCSTNIYIDGNKVMLKVFYRIEEYGGDHTVYSGARTTVLYENTRPGYTLRTVELAGPRLNNFVVYTKGSFGDFKSFEVLDSYWENLEYRIDSNGDDDRNIGIRGRLTFSVILESDRAVRLAGIRQI